MQETVYIPPFHVENQRIVDASGSLVKLWGVNYYAPFNHNFYNMEELGQDHCRAIDRDLHDLKLMGVNFIRMHMYEREITDKDGHLIDNKNLMVFDYLMEKCAENQIFLMLSPMAYWNTVKNQINAEKLYAYWNIFSDGAFGFTNFYSIDALLWHPEAMACQERYFRELFEHKNSFSGKRLCDYDNLIAWELINEMQFPDERLLEEEKEITSATLSAGIYSRGKMRQEFLQKFLDFRNDKSSSSTVHEDFASFRLKLIDDYFERFWGMCEDYFQGKVLRCQFYSYSGLPPADLEKYLNHSEHIDVQCIGTYLNAHGFDSVNTDDADHLMLARQWFARFNSVSRVRPAVSYEFDATATQNGYPLAAIAAMYAQNNVQIAAYFTYTPAVVAAWNPGWLVHFMNLEHTPARAAGFAAAGWIFRSDKIGFTCSENRWSGDDFSIERSGDRVIFNSDTIFCYSDSNDVRISEPEKIEFLFGRGNSRYVQCDGNGIYVLEKCAANKWRLTLAPEQRYLSEPARGRAFTSMANRYVNCNRELPVSLLSTRKLRFCCSLFTVACCRNESSGEWLAAENDRSWRLFPGVYWLTAHSGMEETNASIF